MGRDDNTGRFQPGESPNPGGRPGTALARTLGGRRARRALVDLFEVLGPGLTVVVVDARGLVLSDGGARRAGLDVDDEPAAPVDAELLRARALARVDARAEQTAIEMLAAEGWREVRDVHEVEGGGRQTVSMWHGPNGEEFGFMAWRDVVKRRSAALALCGEPVA